MTNAARRFAGTSVLVTGGARGIGLAIADAFATAGADVLITDIRHDLASGAAEELVHRGARCRSETLDVADLGACEALAAKLADDGVRIATLVNNAGVIFPGTIDEDDAPANWERTLAINVGGVFNMARAFRRQLIATRGSMINLASIRSFVAAGNAAAYAASKGAVVQLTKALALEWSGEGVRVNAIAPGFIDTPLIPAEQKTPERMAGILARTPIGRTGMPEEIAGAALFLASPAASFITGATLPVDGGYLAG
ncbi:MAG TPA: SDR family NAD(P)-dependent oxidoreductase [Sphingomonadaceae bacterium]|nr:SDR family NAD(P)-dependent oxidoreductase [Sphingomonadaceae bacterium]